MTTLQQNRTFAVVIINNAQRFFTLRKGCPIEKIPEINTDTVSSILQTQSIGKALLKVLEILMPVEHQDRLMQLLRQIVDLFEQTE